MKWFDLLINIFTKINPSDKKIDSPKAAVELADNFEKTIRRRKLTETRTSGSFWKTGGADTKIFKNQRPTFQAHWVFIVVNGTDKGRQFIGATDKILVGRQIENHICLKDPKISRVHAVIYIQGLSLVIKDLNSTNGTLVNGKRVHWRKRLRSGDLIKIGDSELEVVLKND